MRDYAMFGWSLDRFVRFMICLRGLGKTEGAYYNGRYFLSSLITLDSAYQKVYHKSRTEFMKEKWLEKAKDIILPSQYEEWLNCVETLLDKPMILDVAINLIKLLNEGEDEDNVVDRLNSLCLPLDDIELIRTIVYSFVPDGLSFFEKSRFLTLKRTISSNK